MKVQIPNHKHQISNKSQIQIPNDPNWLLYFEFRILVIVVYLEFGLCDLLFYLGSYQKIDK
jgi:hypothetical protein